MNDDITPIIESVASEMGRRYSRFGADRDDLAQEAYLWLYDHPQKVADFLDDDKHGHKKLALTLRRELQDYGESVKAQHLGYSRDDLYYFHKGEVRALLDAMFDEEAWTEPPVSDGGPTGRRDPATGGGWIATLADVSQGFAKLSAEDRDLLHGFHRDGWANKMMAESAGISEQTMSYRHDMAVKRLVDILGGPKVKAQHDETCDHPYRPHYGRRAVSNSHARAIQQGYYDE